MGFLPQTQAPKELSKDVPLVNETNDSLAGAGFHGCVEAIDAFVPFSLSLLFGKRKIVIAEILPSHILPTQQDDGGAASREERN